MKDVQKRIYPLSFLYTQCGGVVSPCFCVEEQFREVVAGLDNGIPEDAV